MECGAGEMVCNAQKLLAGMGRTSGEKVRNKHTLADIEAGKQIPLTHFMKKQKTSVLLDAPL